MEDRSLLAHLVPRMTSQVEDAATECLAWVLNRSELCRSALIDLLSTEEFRPARISSVKTQVSPAPAARLDLVGYDENGAMALIVESKFWATLRDGQASGYVDYLNADDGSVLLFVVPEARHAALWSKIEAQFASEKPDAVMAPVSCGPQMAAFDVSHAEAAQHAGARVVLTSWRRVLDALETADEQTAPDVRQLRGLASDQDDAAFEHFHADDFSTAIPRRVLDFYRVADDVVDARGVPEGWMSTKGLRATPQVDGYLRYFRFRSPDESILSSDIALYVSLRQWAKAASTPLWIRIWKTQTLEIEAVRNSDIDVKIDWMHGDHLWIPLPLLTGAEFSEVVDDAATAVKRVSDIVLSALTQSKTD